MRDDDLVATLVRSAPPHAAWPTPIPREPLTGFPQPVDYEHELRVPPPPGRDLYYVRANFCGIWVKGMPLLPGGSDKNPECVMSCLLDSAPLEWQKAYLKQYVESGYTHLQRSIGHSLFYGNSLQSHIDLSKRAQQDYGLFADEWWLGVWEIMSPNGELADYQALVDPWIDALLKANVVDSACVGWQLDQFMGAKPGNPTMQLVQWIANRMPPECPVYTHWVNHALAWWRTGGDLWQDEYQTINVTDRFSWWKSCAPYLTGGYHQGPTMEARTNPGLYQAHLRDTLNPFTDGRMGKSWRHPDGHRNFALVGYEMTGQDQFDASGGHNPQCYEPEGDRTGYLIACTTSDHDREGHSGGPYGMSGYGNGARRPDGTQL